MLERRYLLFKFVFLLLKTKYRLGGTGGHCPHDTIQWYFWNFHYPMVSINTLLHNPNLIDSESFLPYFRERKQSIELNLYIFLFVFSNFHHKSLHKNQQKLLFMHLPMNMYLFAKLLYVFLVHDLSQEPILVIVHLQLSLYI